MPNKTRPPKVTDKQKIENLLNHIHGMQDRLDEKDRVIAAQQEIITGYKDLVAEMEENARLKRALAPGAIYEPQTRHRDGHARRLWQTRRRYPRG